MLLRNRLNSLYERIEMNLGDSQRGGDIFQPLALLSGNALIGEQGKIRGANDFHLGLTSHASRCDRKLCQHVSLGNVSLNRKDYAAYVHRTTGLILIDLLN